MNTVERVGQALVQEKGFKPLAQLPLSDVTTVAPTAYDFIGVRLYWGSITSIALIRADGLTQPQIQDACQRFVQVTQALTQHTGTMEISTKVVKLGSFGIICFVFENGCPAELVRFVQEQKRGNFGTKEYTLSWVIDAQAGRVHTHRLFPLGVFPGKKYLEDVLRRPGDQAHQTTAA